MIRKFITYLILTAVLIAFAFGFAELKNNKINQITQDAEKTQAEKLVLFKQIENNIKAKSFCVYDIKSDTIIYSREKDMQLPLASLTKIMSAIVIDNEIERHELVEINKEAIRQEGDTGLFEYEKWDKSDLLDLTLMTSSNDGIYALSSYIDSSREISENTISLMNDKAKEIGLLNTVFFNESGLDISEDLSGAYSTSFDVSKLLSYITISNSALLSSTVYNNLVLTSENNLKHIAKNTNKIIGEIPSAIASKTGFTDLAGGNLAIVFDVGMLNPVAIVVLGSDIDSRFTDMKELILATLYYFAQ